MSNFYSGTIQKGSQGDDVKAWQEFLRSKNFNVAVDGIFGDETETATKSFQSMYGIGADGIVGEQTWGKAGYSKIDTSTNNGFEDFKYDDFSYDEFAYDEYKESDTVKQAENALNSHLANKPGEYQSQWQAQLDQLMNSIMNREKFSYDFNSDALYQQYKDKYIQQGKLAMSDAIGQASAMTGGYGNSYAQAVGQQQYQQSLDNLNDIVPELYAMALDQYNREGQDLYNQYGMVADRENLDYSRYRDTVSDYLTERDYLAGRFDSERDYDYSKYNNERDFAYGKYSDDRNLAYDEYATDRNLSYQEYRNAIADEQWQKEYDESVRQYNEQMAFQKQQYADSKVSDSGGGSSGGSGGGSGSSYDNGGLTDAQVKELQNALGVTADGKYGSISKEAAGGLSAKEAYEKYVGNKKGYFDYDEDTHNAIITENGGSYYGKALDVLKELKRQGKSNLDVSDYLQELVGNSIITKSEYMTLYNKYRDNRL